MLHTILTIILAGLTTIIFSKLIDWFYSRESNDLSFPEQIKKRAILRQPLLFIGSAAAFFQFDTNYPLAGFMNLCFYLSLLIISVTDWEQYIIFDSIVLFFTITGLCHSLIASCSPEYLNSLSALPQIIPPGPKDATLTCLGTGVLMLLLAIILKGSIFGGDIKLIAASGIWLGSKYIPAAIVLGFIFGGLAAIFLLTVTKKSKKDYFAYGPYFAIAAAIVRTTGLIL